MRLRGLGDGRRAHFQFDDGYVQLAGQKEFAHGLQAHGVIIVTDFPSGITAATQIPQGFPDNRVGVRVSIPHNPDI
jgi:hypothetical protein